MERNANDTFGNQNTSDASSGPGFGSTSGQPSQAGSQGNASSTADASFSRDTSSDRNVTDRARSALSEAGSTVRDRAGNLKNSLADALESGAERLRQQQGSGGGQIAGAAATGGSTGMVSDQSNRMADMSNQVAGGMQGAADWLRDADLDGLKSGLERQVKDHPGRTLAVAVGLGYLLGKAIRK